MQVLDRELLDMPADCEPETVDRSGDLSLVVVDVLAVVPFPREQHRALAFRQGSECRADSGVGDDQVCRGEGSAQLGGRRSWLAWRT